MTETTTGLGCCHFKTEGTDLIYCQAFNKHFPSCSCSLSASFAAQYTLKHFLSIEHIQQGLFIITVIIQGLNDLDYAGCHWPSVLDLFIFLWAYHLSYKCRRKMSSWQSWLADGYTRTHTVKRFSQGRFQTGKTCKYIVPPKMKMFSLIFTPTQ